MNCFRAQQLLSPYLDQQLTGAEMLEVQRHLDGCFGCTEEYQSARQVKLLLHSLSLPRAESSLEARILSRLAQEERRGVTHLPRHTTVFRAARALAVRPHAADFTAAPSRGRRLTAALALSCLAVFAAAAPFAPSTPSDSIEVDRAALEQVTLLEPMPNAGLHAAPDSGVAWMRPVSADTTGLSAPPGLQGSRGVAAAQYDVQPPLADAGAEPLGDAVASGYVSGDVAFVGYRVR